MPTINLKNILITLGSIAGVLGLITIYVVFYGGGGTYVVGSPLGSTTTFSSSSTPPLASSTATSTLATATSSPTSTTQTGGAPITWQEGNEMISITGASLNGTQLTLELQIAMGGVSECVPMNMRLVIDENGDMTNPVTPQFAFPDTGTCNGTPGETYTGQQVVFSIPDPTAFPFILTTGGASNVVFEVTQDSGGSLIVELPPRSD